MTQSTSSAVPDLKRHVLPGSVSQVATITKYELVNYFRSRRFFVLLIIGLIISALLTTLVGYYRPSSFLSSTLNFLLGLVGRLDYFRNNPVRHLLWGRRHIRRV